MKKKVYIRAYEELNDYLPGDCKKKQFSVDSTGRTFLKEIIKDLGIPESEIDLILVDGQPVNFDYQVKNNDRISIFPVFESLNIASVTILPNRPLRNPKFVAEKSLKPLLLYLVSKGFDCISPTFSKDWQFYRSALNQGRILICQDFQLPKKFKTDRYYVLKERKTENQYIEIINRFDLDM